MKLQLMSAVFLYLLLLWMPRCSGEQCKNPVLKQDECVCTYDMDTLISVECSKEDIITGDNNIFDSIGKTVRNITIMHRAWDALPPTHREKFNMECLAQNTTFNELTYLRISQSQVRQIGQRAFHCMPNLETLALDDNDWLVNATGGNSIYTADALKDLPALKALHLRNAFTQVADWVSIPDCDPKKVRHEKGCMRAVPYYPNPDMILKNINTLANLVTLDLSRNRILGFDSDLWCNMPKLETLGLSSNLISHPEMNYICASELQEIRLDDNLITSLPKNTTDQFDLMPRLNKLILSNNNFRCDCEMIEFYHWLLRDASHYVLNKEALVCDSPESLSKSKSTIVHLGEEDLVCIHPHASTHNTASIMIGLTVVALCLLLVIVVFWNRALIKKKCTRFLTPLKRKANFEGYPYSTVEL